MEKALKLACFFNLSSSFAITLRPSEIIAKMPHMEPEAFEREIRSPERKSFYLVLGVEPSAVSRCLDAAKAAVDPGFLQMNFRHYRADDLNKSGWSRLEADVTVNPFGPPPKVLVVRVASQDKFSAETSEIMRRVKAKINKLSTLVFFCEDIPDVRLKFFKELAKEGGEVNCRAPEGNELPKWLIGRFRARGATLTMDGARTIIERAGDDLRMLECEAEKLSIYPGQDFPIDSKVAASLVSLGPTAELYELGAPLGEGRLDKALPRLFDLLETMPLMRIIYAIGTHFTRLLAVKSLEAARGRELDDQAIASAAKINIYAVRHLRPQLAKWTLPMLKEAIAALEEAHRALFSSKAGGDLILQSLAVKLGVLAGGGESYGRQDSGDW